jgi:SAM-dependent methyltransferase
MPRSLAKGQSVDLKDIFYPESRFGGFSDVDGTVAFYLRVKALTGRDSILLDFGCGRGAYGEDPIPLRRDLRIFKGQVGRVIGLDVDDAAAGNPFLDEFYLLESNMWPLPENSIDLIICDNVLEHLQQPEVFFFEARRVLRNGGCLCIRTPNLWGYVALAARLVPNRSHCDVLVRVKENTKIKDVFPTHYQCNTLPRLRKHLESCGFRGSVYGYGPEPAYLSFSKLTYFLGVMYQRYAPRFLQPVIFSFTRLNK